MCKRWLHPRQVLGGSNALILEKQWDGKSVPKVTQLQQGSFPQNQKICQLNLVWKTCRLGKFLCLSKRLSSSVLSSSQVPHCTFLSTSLFHLLGNAFIHFLQQKQRKVAQQHVPTIADEMANFKMLVSGTAKVPSPPLIWPASGVEQNFLQWICQLLHPHIAFLLQVQGLPNWDPCGCKNMKMRTPDWTLRESCWKVSFQLLMVILKKLQSQT